MFLNGGSGKDKLTGGAGADTLYGLGGDDSLSGLGGEDVLAGNNGNDSLSGGAGDDYLMGGLGNDRIGGGTGFDWAGYEDATAGVRVDLALTTAQNTLGAGTDQLSSIEHIYGSSYGDTLSGTSGFNYIFGGDGNDSLVGRAGDDFLAGGAGNDLIDGGANDDTVSFDDGVAGGVVVSLITQTAEGHGHDSLVSIESVYGSGYADQITGSGGDNYLFGGAGDDTLAGSDTAQASDGNDVVEAAGGNDLMFSGRGDDILDGGDDFDTVSYAYSAAAVNVDLKLSDPQDTVGAGHDRLLSIEKLYGSSWNDTLASSVGGELRGGDGDDLLFGDSGYDILDGGAGSDLASYQNAGFAVQVDMSLTGYQYTGGGGWDQFVGIEGLQGSAFNDTLTGDGAANILDGRDGVDSLSGGDGADTFIGGGGNDHINGGAGTDMVSFFDGATHGVAINVGATYGEGIKTVTSVESIVGTQFVDDLKAAPGDNSLFGMGGDDTLSVDGLGQDVLDGGAGDDLLVLQSGYATPTGNTLFQGGDGFDTMNLYFNDLSNVGIKVDLASAGQQTLMGNETATLNSIEGAIGSAMSDTFYASSVTNSFKGAGGQDHFVFRSLGELGNGEAADRISDFNSNGWPGTPDDVIDVSAIDADVNTTGDQAFHTVSAFTHHAGEVTWSYVAANNAVLVQFDVNGDAEADASLWVTTGFSSQLVLVDASFVL